MTNPVSFVEIHRGDFLESEHSGHAVICDDTGQIVEAWGDPDKIVLPRSSSKMIQALPLITSGAAKVHGLTDEHLALSCASHNGAAIHTTRVQTWLASLGLGDDDFRCGPQTPNDVDAAEALVKAGQTACQYHNNCSGKHAGFLTLSQHLKAGPDYIDADHPVQQAAHEAWETVTSESTSGYVIDGCSAPNHASSLHGMARAMAWFASAHERSDAVSQAAVQLRTAMATHPDLVAGEGRACTELMRAMDGKVTIKTGAEGFFVAIIPERKMGVALKITDGTTRASECAMASILVKLGVLDAAHPATLKRRNAPIRNWRGIETGIMRPSAHLL